MLMLVLPLINCELIFQSRFMKLNFIISIIKISLDIPLRRASLSSWHKSLPKFLHLELFAVSSTSHITFSICVVSRPLESRIKNK